MDAFIAVKGHKAKGKRLSTYDIKKVEFVEPLEKEASAFQEEEVPEIPSDEITPLDDSAAEQMSLEM